MGFQIAPMIDVVFVLMLFFMASAGFKTTEKELGITLGGRPAGGETPGLLLIDISAEGQVTMNSQPLGTPADRNLPELRASLKHIIEQFGQTDHVIIRPSSLTRHERIMDVLNAASAAGVQKISFS